MDNPDVLVEAGKLADDRSGDLVVRLYELRGRRATAHVEFADPGEVAVCDLLERDLPEVAALAPLAQVPGGCSSDVEPFQVVIRSSACLRAAG